jgi:catechol 2,3-dioxygenase-like lactoylglutathione lyase family enzyme
MIKSRLAISTVVLGSFVAGLVVGGRVGSQPIGTSILDSFVTGIGGVFFKVDDPEKSRAWYREHLGIDGATPGINYLWREPDDPSLLGFTVWSAFPRDSSYFGPGAQEFMINYRVRDLDALLSQLRAQGVRQEGGIETYWYGRFAWIVDGDGHRVELWEPLPMRLSPQEFRQRIILEEAGLAGERPD